MKYVGNCSEYISLEILNEIKNTDGDIRPCLNDFKQDYKDAIISKWIQAGYDLNKIKWTMYYEEHLSSRFVLPPIFKNVIKWWFVKLNPGDVFPHHLDLYQPKNDAIRYWIACEDYTPGHIFSYGGDVLTNYKAGDIFLFDASEVYHGACNIGFTPKISLQVMVKND